MDEKEQPKIWINLLNHGSYEDIGKAVIDVLMTLDAKKETIKGGKIYHREIIVLGS